MKEYAWTVKAIKQCEEERVTPGSLQGSHFLYSASLPKDINTAVYYIPGRLELKCLVMSWVDKILVAGCCVCFFSFLTKQIEQRHNWGKIFLLWKLSWWKGNQWLAGLLGWCREVWSLTRSSAIGTFLSYRGRHHKHNFSWLWPSPPPSLCRPLWKTNFLVQRNASVELPGPYFAFPYVLPVGDPWYFNMRSQFH